MPTAHIRVSIIRMCAFWVQACACVLGMYVCLDLLEGTHEAEFKSFLQEKQ